MKKTFILFGFCLCLLGLTTSQTEAQVIPGLIAHWKFDEGTGTIAGDSAGTNTGTLTNGPTWTTGKIGSALSFDGVNDYVNNITNTVPAYVAGGAISISAWVNGAPGTDGVIYSEGNSNTNTDVFRISRGFANGSKAHLLIRNAGGVRLNVDSASTAFDNTWHHIVYTDTNGTAKFYVDGIQDATNFNYTPQAIPTNNSTIGAYKRANNSIVVPFPGKIDDVRLYNRALTASEVQQIFNGAP